MRDQTDGKHRLGGHEFLAVQGNARGYIGRRVCRILESRRSGPGPEPHPRAQHTDHRAASPSPGKAKFQQPGQAGGGKEDAHADTGKRDRGGERGPARRREPGNVSDAEHHHYRDDDPDKKPPEGQPDKAPGRNTGDQRQQRERQTDAQYPGFVEPSAQSRGQQRANHIAAEIKRPNITRLGFGQRAGLDKRRNHRRITEAAKPHADQKPGLSAKRVSQPDRHSRLGSPESRLERRRRMTMADASRHNRQPGAHPVESAIGVSGLFPIHLAPIHLAPSHRIERNED